MNVSFHTAAISPYKAVDCQAQVASQEKSVLLNDHAASLTNQAKCAQEERTPERADTGKNGCQAN